jgi:hypothetical protein
MHHQTLSGEDDKDMFYTLLCMFFLVMFCSVFPIFIDNLQLNKGFLMFWILFYLEQLIMFMVACVSRLVTMVRTFIGNKGGTKDFTLSFILGGDYLTLRLNAYIELLDNEKDFLSTNAMNFFRLWYMHTQFTNRATYITHPHY